MAKDGIRLLGDSFLIIIVHFVEKVIFSCVIITQSFIIEYYEVKHFGRRFYVQN
jgi:hypothetical protein